MGSPAPPIPMDRVTEALFRVRGQDPQDKEALVGRILGYIHLVLPDPPVSRRATLRACLPNDDVDRVSALPYALLRDIVSRLPDKDAARTAVLATRWRELWRRAPLVLVDSHFLPAGTVVGRAEARRVTSAVSRILHAHPGPFRCVHLTSSYMEEFQCLLTPWLQTLAAKGIQELVLFNRPCPLDFLLPATFLGMTTLTRLHLGMWKFPDTAGVSRTTCFPNLRELGFISVFMESRDLDFILDRSPVLETLFVGENMFKIPLRLVSQSLRCVQIVGCSFEEISVVDAPCLERFIYSGGWTFHAASTKMNIGHAPKLQLLGIIKAGAKASPSTVVPSVRILALEVCFGVRNDVKMIPTILRCFPNIEMLHLMSAETDQPSGKVNLKFWNESGTIECIRSCIKQLVFHYFKWGRSELAFLKIFLGSALVLKEAVIVIAYASFTSEEDLHSKVAPLGSMKWASAGSSIRVYICSKTEGDNMRSYKRSSDFSLRDPFAI